MGESWVDIPRWEGKYQVSNHGRVRSVDRIVCYSNGLNRLHKGRVLKLKEHSRGYGHKIATLQDQNRKESHCVHSLVLRAFIGEAGIGQEARHLNGDASDNRLENLCWGSRVENRRDRMVHAGNVSGDYCSRGHLLAEWNVVKKGKSGRSCLACDRALSKRSTYRRRYGVDVDLLFESDKRFRKLAIENGLPMDIGVM